MKNYTNILEAMNALMTAMNEEHIRLVAESNAQAEEARQLIARVQNTISKHEELTAVVGEVSKQMAVAESSMKVVTGNIKDALTDLNEGEIPLCSVDKYVGHCSECGEELTTDMPWTYDEGGEPICATCLGKNVISAEYTEAEATEAEAN